VPPEGMAHPKKSSFGAEPRNKLDKTSREKVKKSRSEHFPATTKANLVDVPDRVFPFRFRGQTPAHPFSEPLHLCVKRMGSSGDYSTASCARGYDALRIGSK
jgi:hypothetical protein